MILNIILVKISRKERQGKKTKDAMKKNLYNKNRYIIV